MPDETCLWSDDEDYYETACGECFSFFEGSPADNKFVFCPYCGKKIQEKEFSDD